MRKTLIFVSTFLLFLINAQNNETLKKEFEQQNKSDTQKFNTYISKRYSVDKKAENRKEIDEQRKNLAGFDPEGKPYFYHTSDMNQILNSNSDHLQSGTVNGLTGSFNGENIKFTVFDDARAFENHILFDNAPDRISNKESSIMNYGAHATEVTGFIGARDYPISDTFPNGTPFNINFRGIAQNATFDNYSFQNTVLPGRSDTLNVYQKILIAQPKISNHSYGTAQGWLFTEVNGSPAWLWNGSYDAGASLDLQGTYYTGDRNFDQIVYFNPSYILVKAAGNEYGSGPGGNTIPKYYRDSTGNEVEFTSTDLLPENDCSSGYDCIGVSSLAKNIIVVGATDMITANGGRYVSPSDVVRSFYSSVGPRDDGGIKPDISTTGTQVVSASVEDVILGDDTVLIDGQGTSYSAPVVTGIIGLWGQINKQLFNTELNAASAKTLMIHSASEAGNIGPDPLFGWGYINAKKGAELLVGKSNNVVIFDNEVLASGIINQKTVQASGNEPLKVTISWIDPAFTNLPTTMAAAYNNRASRLINDLDLRIIDTVTNTIYYPWKLDANAPMTPAAKADNTVDNVEQVIIDAPTTGRNYRIEISNKGSLVNNDGQSSPQNYTILVTGHSEEQFLATNDLVKKSNNIVVVPTMTKDIVKILKAPNNSTFNVYDLSGKKLKSGIIKSDEENIDFSSYTKGIYIIEIKTEKETISKKIIRE